MINAETLENNGVFFSKGELVLVSLKSNPDSAEDLYPRILSGWYENGCGKYQVLAYREDDPSKKNYNWVSIQKFDHKKSTK